MKLLLLLPILLLTACASPEPRVPYRPINRVAPAPKVIAANPITPEQILNGAESPPEAPVIAPDNLPHTELTDYAQSLLGVPYRYGGNSPDSGFDCSGFVTHVYRRALGITLPRSSHEMSYRGSALNRDELQPGDLVFFNTLRRKFSHVGIYLGNDNFIHSPSRGGSVRIDELNNPYWRKSYNGARRVSEQP